MGIAGIAPGERRGLLTDRPTHPESDWWCEWTSVGTYRVRSAWLRDGSGLAFRNAVDRVQHTACFYDIGYSQLLCSMHTVLSPDSDPSSVCLSINGISTLTPTLGFDTRGSMRGHTFGGDTLQPEKRSINIVT